MGPRARALTTLPLTTHLAAPDKRVASFLHKVSRIRTPIPPSSTISRDEAPQRGPDPKRRSKIQNPKNQKNSKNQKITTDPMWQPPIPNLQVFYTKCHGFGCRSRHPARFRETELPRGVPTPKGAPKSEIKKNKKIKNSVRCFGRLFGVGTAPVSGESVPDSDADLAIQHDFARRSSPEGS